MTAPAVDSEPLPGSFHSITPRAVAEDSQLRRRAADLTYVQVVLFKLVDFSQLMAPLVGSQETCLDVSSALSHIGCSREGGCVRAPALCVGVLCVGLAPETSGPLSGDQCVALLTCKVRGCPV